MTKKTAILSALDEYFKSKGGFLTMQEYKDAEDAPIRFQNIKRTFGSWNRLKNMLGYREADPVIIETLPGTEETPETPVEQAPVAEAPVEQIPVVEVPVEPAPVVEAPAPVEEPAPAAPVKTAAKK